MCHQIANDISLKEAVDFLEKGNCFTLYCHSGPDGDTVGSAVALCLALRQKGKECHVFVCDKLPEKLAFIDECGCIDGVRNGFSVSVDIASTPMLGEFKALSEDGFDLTIDHHKFNTVPCRRRILRDSYVACGELVFELIKEMHVDIDKHMALALYSAISSDSGCFKYEGTRPETHIMASELLRTGINFALINRQLFEQKTITQIQLEKAALENLSFYLNGRLAVVELDKDVLCSVESDESDMDNLKQLPRQIAGVEVSAFVRHYGDVTKVSLRSNDFFDVASFASENFGGGGHIHAAAFRIPYEAENIGRLLAEKLEGLI